MSYKARPKTAKQKACKKKLDAVQKKFTATNKARYKACKGYGRITKKSTAKCRKAHKAWMTANRAEKKTKCNPGWVKVYDPYWTD